ncbi:MAG: chemotaxis protein CheW [Opitutales bacterium]
MKSFDAESLTGQYITFKLGDETFAVSVHQVREVLDITEFARIPNAPDYMRGVVNVRGSAIPVVDLRKKFGLPSTEPSDDSRIVIIELQTEDEVCVVGGMADSVKEVLELRSSDIDEPPKLGVNWHSEFIQGLGKQGDEFIILLNMQHLFEMDDLADTLTELNQDQLEAAAQPAAQPGK